MENGEDVVWLSVEEKSHKRLALYGLGAAALLIGFLACIAVVWRVTQLITGADGPVRVAPHIAPEDYLTESSRFFLDFDGSLGEETTAESAPTNKASDIVEATKALEALAACSAEDDEEAFAELVDSKRLRKRVQMALSDQQLDVLQKFELRQWVKGAIDLDSCWCNPVVVGVVRPRGDPDTRVVYSVGSNAYQAESSEYRLVFTRNGGDWRLYDWCRLDLGVMESQLIAMRFRDAYSTPGNQYSLWVNVLSEAIEAQDEGEYEKGRRALLRAELRVPRGELHDYCMLITGYKWQNDAFGEDALRCFRAVSRPDLFPGAYYGMGNCLEESEPEKAIENFQAYYDRIGPAPDISARLASLHDRLDNTAQARAHWRDVLRADPGNLGALSELLMALPADSKSDFFPLLDRNDNPPRVASELVSYVVRDDDDAAVALVDYLQESAPDDAATHAAVAKVKAVDGRFHEAAASYLKAVRASSEDQNYTWRLLEAAIPAGEVLETMEALPDQASAYEQLFYGYDDGDFELTQDEYRQLVKRRLDAAPDDTDAATRGATLFAEDGRVAEAEGLLRASLDRLSTAEGTEAEEEQDYTRSQLMGQLVELLAEQERYDEARALACEDDTAFDRLVRSLVSSKERSQLATLLSQASGSGRERATIAGAKGELALLNESPDEARARFLTARNAAESYHKWQYNSRYRELCLQGGDWHAYYDAAEDRSEAFDELSLKFIELEDWGALEALHAKHAAFAGGEGDLTLSRADAAWQRNEHAAYERIVSQIDQETLKSLPRHKASTLESRRFTAYLRLGAHTEARRAAEQQNDLCRIAAAHAAAGDPVSAKKAARRALANDESLSRLYQQEVVGRRLLTPEYADLTRSEPVSAPYNAIATVAVAYGPGRVALGQRELNEAADRLSGTDAGAGFTPVVGDAALGLKTHACRFGDATVWVSFSEGAYYDGLRAEEDSQRHGVIDNPQGWMAVGVSAWDADTREAAFPFAKRVARDLFASHGKVIRLSRPNGSLDYHVLPNRQEILAEWVTTGKLDRYSNERVELDYAQDYQTKQQRDFQAGLYEALREHNRGGLRNLFVQAKLSGGFSPCADWFKVAKAKRQVSVSLEGPLQSPSSLLTDLREGLHVQAWMHQVVAWRWDAGEPQRLPAFEEASGAAE